MDKLLTQFSMVRCADVKTAKRLKTTNVPMLIFFDGDGEEMSRISVRSVEAVTAAFKRALANYADSKLEWPSGTLDDVTKAAAEQKKMIALIFVDDEKFSKRMLLSMENRWIAKHHDNFLFYRIPFNAKSTICKQWGVTQSPTLLLVNPLQNDPSKIVLERMANKTRVRTVRNVILRGIHKFGDFLKE